MFSNSVVSEDTEFVAGLIYGFTGENHLDELQTCFDQEQVLSYDAKKLLQDLVAKSVFHGARDFKRLKKDLNEALADCKDT